MNFSSLDNTTAMYSPRSVNLISGIWMCLVFVIGITANAFVLFIFSKDRKIITPYRINIIGMIINNLCMCSMGFGMPTVADFSGHFLLLMNMDLCVAEAFIVYLFGLATLFILTAIAISRYIIVTKRRITVTKRISVISVCICEFLALMFASAPFLGWGWYGLEAHGTGCGLDWRDASDSAITYIITITIFCYALPVAINIYCYQRIYAKVSLTHKLVQNISPNRNHIVQNTTRREEKLFKVSLAIIAAFLITWTPYAIVSFYTVFGNPRNMHPLLSRSASLLAKSNVIWNTALYILVSEDFRETAKAVLKTRTNRDDRRNSGIESPIPLANMRALVVNREEELSNGLEIIEHVSVL